MSLEVIGAAVAVIGVLLWMRRDLRHDIAEMRADVRALDASPAIVASGSGCRPTNPH